MKTIITSNVTRIRLVAFAVGFSLLLASVSTATDIVKADNDEDLNLVASWVGETVPGDTHVAVWDDTVGANTTVLGADLSWSGIRIAGTTETGLVRINPGNTLTLGSEGIDLADAIRDLFLNVTVNADADQTWDVAAGRTLSHVNINNDVILTGSGNITKTGAGTLYLYNNLGTNDFTGDPTIAEGRLQVAASITTEHGGNFILKDGVRVENASTATATVTLLSGTRVTHIDGNVTFVGTTGGTSDSTRLVFGADRQTDPPTRAVNLRTNVEINVENPLNAAGGGYVTISGISESNGSHSLTKTGPGMLTLIRNTSSYTGGTYINEGILELGTSGGANRLAPGDIFINGGTLRMTGVIGNQSTIGTLTLSSGAIDGNSANTLTAASYTMASGAVGIALAGTGGLTKNTTGTVTMTADHTYTGATTVEEGLLVVNGSLAAGSAVNVQSGGALGGSGTIGGATTINGSLRPGNSIGTLTVESDVTWTGTGTAGADDWVFELGAPGDSDLLDITGGDFLKGAGSNFIFNFAGTGELGTYTLVQWSGSTTFDEGDFGYTNLAEGYTGEFAFGGDSLTFTVIPEPGSIALLLAGVALVAIARRKQC